MKKIDELSQPHSCLNRAADDELLFVLLGRDAAAPRAIRAWVSERLRLGKNQEGDPQIVEARDCAGKIAAELELQIQAPTLAAHLLTRIREDPRLAYYFDPMSKSMQLLTEEHARDFGLDVEDFRTRYYPLLRFEAPRSPED